MVPLILGVITNAFDCLVVNWLDLRLNVYGKSLNIHDMYCRHLKTFEVVLHVNQTLTINIFELGLKRNYVRLGH